MSLKKKLSDIVGPDNVADHETVLEKYASNEGIFSGVTPSFVARPSNAAEVRSLVRLANEEKVPLIPVSSGVHFNDSALPTQGGLIVDLGGMNRIVEVDVRNRRAMIEPGVRWGQLQRHLKEMNMVAMNPLFPHSSQSVVTSYLERQPPIIPKFEYAEPIMTLEVVLPSGEILRTGSASAPGAPTDTLADMVCPYGPGIDFYRLFQGAQGTLGLITWMNIKVEYFSNLRKTFYIQSDGLGELLSFVHKLQRFMVGNECFLLKRPDVAAIASDGDRDRMRAISNRIKRWTVVVQLAGAKRRPEERLAYQEKAFHQLCAEHQIFASGALTDSGLEARVFEEHLQEPWPEGKTYWKHLLHGSCHDIAFHTTADRLLEMVSKTDSLLSEKGQGEESYGMYIQPLEYGRAYYCRYHLCYDPCQPDQVKRVTAIDGDLNRELFLSGAMFSTPYGEQVPLTCEHATIYAETLKKVKAIFDPAGIMNPGRLCF